jgi:hypothetical protein
MSIFSPSLFVLALAVSLSMPVQVHAAQGIGADTGQAQSAKKAKRRAHLKPMPQVERTPSGETMADRERRLRRECKGRPNAGACLGLTH